MLAEIDARRREIEDLCRRFGVRRLDLFGSAAESLGERARDLDFLVDLGEIAPTAYAEAYFGLLESLESLFERPVDLVTEASVSNRYFRREHRAVPATALCGLRPRSTCSTSTRPLA